MQGTHNTIYTNEHPAIKNTEDASVILKIMLIQLCYYADSSVCIQCTSQQKPVTNYCHILCNICTIMQMLNLTF